jgi:hypothetical protein
MEDTIKLKGTYTFTITGVDGKIRDTFSVDNIVTSAGKAQLALLAYDSTANPFLYLAVGTSSTAVAIGQTTLGAEITDTGLARSLATGSRTTTTVTNDTMSITYTWTASGVKAIEEVGVFSASSSGVMLSRALTGTKTTANGETVQATYTLAFA